MYNKYFIRKHLTGKCSESARDINILTEPLPCNEDSL